MIDPKLLEVLACPACEDRPPVRLEGETLVCDRCRRVYPILDGIPQMLVESAILREGPESHREVGGMKPEGGTHPSDSHRGAP